MSIPAIAVRAAPVAAALSLTAVSYAAAGLGLIGGLVAGTKLFARFLPASPSEKMIAAAMSKMDEAPGAASSPNGLDLHPIG